VIHMDRRSILVTIGAVEGTPRDMNARSHMAIHTSRARMIFCSSVDPVSEGNGLPKCVIQFGAMHLFVENIYLDCPTRPTYEETTSIYILLCCINTFLQHLPSSQSS
jgi:hypothetical protein